MQLKNITVTIHGREYKISSVRDPEYTQKLAKYCDLIMKKIESGTGSVDYMRLTILTMLQVAHNYFECEEGTSKPAPKVEAEVDRLIKLLAETDKQVAKL